MGKQVTLTDRITREIIYPVTTLNSVYNQYNTTLSDLLDQINTEIQDRYTKLDIDTLLKGQFTDLSNTDNKISITVGSVSKTLEVAHAANADTSTYPLGFTRSTSSWSWGHLITENGYSQIIDWVDGLGGDIAFANNGGQLSVQTDGAFWQREGLYMCLDSGNYLDYALPLSGGTLTGVLQLSNSGLKFADDAFGGGCDIAKMYLATKGGEAITMTFEVENDSDDTINFITPSDFGLTHNNNIIFDTGNYSNYAVARTSATRPGVTRLYRRDDDTNYSVQTSWTGSLWKLYGYKDDVAHAGVTVAHAENAETLNGFSTVTAGTATNIYNHIPVIGADGVIEIGKYIDFHSDNTTSIDFSTRIQSNGNNSNILTLPTSTGTLALTSDIPSLSDSVTLTTAQTISGVKTFSTQQEFTVADGTSPFTVTSNTLVSNLNADLLDGHNFSDLYQNLSNTSTKPDCQIVNYNNSTVDSSLFGIIGGNQARVINAYYGDSWGAQLAFGFSTGRLAWRSRQNTTSWSTWYNITAGYSDSSGNSDTVDGYHASGLAKWENITSFTADVGSADGFHIVINNATNAANSNHSMFLSVNNVGTPFILQFSDSTEDYIYKKSYGDSTWRKLKSGYSDSAESATKLATVHSIWGQSFDGTGDVDGLLSIHPNSSNNYNEGIRIHPYGVWTTLMFCGSDNTGDTGTSAKSWSFHTNDTENSFRLGHNGNDYVFLIDSSNNIGIGTTDPLYKLDVNGSLQAGASILHNLTVYTDDNSGQYNTRAIQIREVGKTQDAHSNDQNYAPAIGFHWAGVREAIMSMHSDGKFHFNHSHTADTSYVNLVAGGFQKYDSSDDYVLLGGGSTKAISDFITTSNIGSQTVKRISSDGISSSWIDGRNLAIVRQTSVNGYSSIISTKTTNGSWEIGNYTGFYDYLLITYCTDTDYNAGNNQAHCQYSFDPNKSGTVATTGDIPTIPTLSLATSGTGNAVSSISVSGHTITQNLTTYNNYSLPTAADSTLGGVKTGYTTSGQNYKVSIDASGNLYTYVPWSNTWNANSVNVAGYVSAPTSSNANKVWKTDANGNPGWRTDQDTTSFTLSMAVSPGTSSITLAFGTKYLLTAGGSTYIFTMPDNPNTNYQTGMYVGASQATSNSAVTNPYVNIYDTAIYRSKLQLVGAGGTTITSNDSSVITISSDSAGKIWVANSGITTKYTSGLYINQVAHKTTGCFTEVNNANIVLTVESEPDGKYNKQLGFSSNGNLYYRSFVNADPDSTTAWKTIIDSGNIGSQAVTSASKLTTAVSIWGKTFDGSSNITGNLVSTGLSTDWTYIWSDGTNTHPWYGYDMNHANTGIYSTTISDYFGMTLKTRSTELNLTYDGGVSINKALTITSGGLNLYTNPLRFQNTSGTTLGIIGMDPGALNIWGPLASSATTSTGIVLIGKQGGWRCIQIDSSNNTYIGATQSNMTASGYRLYVDGTQYISSTLTTEGNITAPAFYESSDYRLKNSIYTISNADVKLVDKIKLKEYRFNNDPSKKHYGVVAQDLLDLGMNDLVKGDEKSYYSVDYISLLILKMQAMQNKIDELTKKLIIYEQMFNQTRSL